LVLDRNGNGVIDNGSELFGDSTTVNGVKATDGFSALFNARHPELDSGSQSADHEHNERGAGNNQNFKNERGVA